MAALRARHRISRWGATDEEATCSLAGDETVPAPGIVSTRAIDIHAPAHVVWPWLYERDPAVTEGFIWAAHSRLLLRRLTQPITA